MILMIKNIDQWFLFFFLFNFWLTLYSSKGLFFPPHSDITSGGWFRNIWGAKNQTHVNCM